VDATLILVMIVGATLAVGGVGLGLVAGYWRGRQRGISLAANERLSPELDVLAGVGNAILSVQLKVDALCEVIYQQATRIIDTSTFQIGIFEGNDYVIKVWLRDAERLPAQRFEGKAEEGIIGWVRRTGTGLLVHDFEREWDSLPAHPTHSSPDPARSAILAPLLSGGTTLGVIAVQSHRPNAFSDEDMRLLTLLANQASAAIRNAQTFEAAQERARQLRLINDVARQITATQPLPDLFRQIVTLIHDAFGYYAVSIFIVEEAAQLLRLKSSSHEQFATTDLRLSYQEGIVGWAATNCRTALSSNVSQDERYLATATLEATLSEIAVPLVVSERVVGVLDVQSNHLDAFDTDDVFLLETLAGQLAFALQEAQTFDAERRQTERINAMTEVARALVSILDIDDLLDEVIDLVTEYLGYDRVHLFLRVGERIAFRSGSGVHSGRWALERLSYDLNEQGLIPRVARTGEPVLTGDVREHADYRAGQGVEDTLSELTVPLRIGSTVLGVFDVQSAAPNAFTLDDLALLQALADTIAIALRNATLFANESRRRMLSETLRELSTVLGSSLDLTSVLNGIMIGLERVVPYTSGLIALLDEDEQDYRVETAHISSGEPDPAIYERSIPAAEISDARLIGLLHTLGRGETIPSEHDEIVVPLAIAGALIGFLTVERVGLERFTPEDREIITTFANQAAVAITNARLYMAQREEAWISTALLQVAEATARASDVDEVLSTVAHITPLLVGVEWSAVLLAEGPQEFRVVEIAGADPEISSTLLNYKLTAQTWPPLSQVWQNGQPLLIDSTTLRPTDLPADFKLGQGVILPLFAKGEINGLLLIGTRDDSDLLTDRKIELVSGIANQAALAIESAQLVAAQQEEAWVTTALLQVAEAVSTQIDADQSLETLVRLTPLLIGIERCGILKWEGEAGHFVGGPSWGLTAEHKTLFAELVCTEHDGKFFRRLIEGQELVACGVGTDVPLPSALQRLFDTAALIGLPLVARGHLVGAMLVAHSALDGAIDQGRLNILNGIAHHTALSLENARLQAEASAAERMERELEVARTIQASFLPDELPQQPGWEIAAHYRAARQVGGDFYDFFRVDERRWAIVVADVADKGVPAALFMVLSRTLLRAVGLNRHSPLETLRRVNQLLLHDSRSDLFVTAWYGLWDVETGCVQYCSAGHNPPLLVHADGSAELLSTRGLAMGVVPEIVLHDAEVTLKPGDLLLAYTDGVTEALRADKAEFGVVGLQSTVTSLRKGAARDIAQGLVRALDRFVEGAPQFDDMTFVVLKRLARERDAGPPPLSP
jgi:GAF domain-containing protein